MSINSGVKDSGTHALLRQLHHLKRREDWSV